LKNREPASPDRLAWSFETRKSPTALDRSACLRLFETTSSGAFTPREATQARPRRIGNHDKVKAGFRGTWWDGVAKRRCPLGLRCGFGAGGRSRKSEAASPSSRRQ